MTYQACIKFNVHMVWCNVFMA